MFVKVLPAALKFLADKSNAVQIGAHGELLVLGLDFMVECRFLGKGLMVHRKCEHDIGPDFPGMELTVEAPQLHGMMAVEKTVEIEEMVAALVVMGVTVTTILLVPDPLNLPKCLWLQPVHLLYQISVHLFAVVHPVRCDLESLVKQVVARGNQVNEVTDAARSMLPSVQMDMDAAGIVRKTPGFPQPPDERLDAADILVITEDRADHLHTVAAVRADNPPALFLLASDTAVIHELPDPPIRRGYFVGFIVAAGIPCAAAQIFCGCTGRLFTGNAGKLHLNAKFVCKQLYPTSFLIGGHGRFCGTPQKEIPGVPHTVVSLLK